MASLAKDVRNYLASAITATWTEVDTPILYEYQLGSKNLRDKLLGGHIDVPFVIVQPLPRTVAPYGVNRESYWHPLTVYYIRRDTLTGAETAAGYKQVEQILEDKAQAIVDALQDSSTLWLESDPEVDTTIGNPANQWLLANQHQGLIAVAVHLRFLTEVA